MTGTASAKTSRIPLPGGGSIIALKGYATDAVRSTRKNSTAIFRRLRDNMGGYQECDGLINIGRRDQFSSLDAFALETENAATNEWLHGNLMPGWTSFDSERFPVTARDGPWGRESTQELAVKTFGILGERPAKAWRIAFDHRDGGLFLQVWLFEKEGGLQTARKLVDEIARSFEA